MSRGTEKIDMQIKRKGGYKINVATECLYCTKHKDYNCDYCGDPICVDHAKYDGRFHSFCTFQCMKRWERFREKEIRPTNYD